MRRRFWNCIDFSLPLDWRCR